MSRTAQNNQSDLLSMETLEQLFTAIQERFDEQDELLIKRFNEQDGKLQTILDIVQVYDQERKENRSMLWDHERRLNILEKHSN